MHRNYREEDTDSPQTQSPETIRGAQTVLDNELEITEKLVAEAGEIFNPFLRNHATDSEVSSGGTDANARKPNRSDVQEQILQSVSFVQRINIRLRNLIDRADI
jgi:hypothetical protein